MRKWMRERLQRRKKTPAESSEQPIPPPLQPAYFDAEQSPAAPPEATSVEAESPAELLPAPERRPGRRTRSDSEEQPQEAQPAPAPPATGAASPGRNRRRRGGRGRG